MFQNMRDTSYCVVSKKWTQCARIVWDGKQDAASEEPARRRHWSSERLAVRDDDYHHKQYRPMGHSPETWPFL